MRKKYFLILIITLCTLIVAPSCSRRYYTDHQGKVTKGYNKPPKKWKQPGSRYLEQAKR